MMEMDEGFVREVRANPADDNARLILADYLDDVGDPLGQFIRVQVRLARDDLGPQVREELTATEATLIESHAQSWLQPLRDFGVEGAAIRCFRRGLVERIRMKAKAFLTHGVEVCQISPAVHALDLRRPEGFVQELVEFEMPAQISVLDLSSNALNGPTSRLLRAPWMSQMETLDLQFNYMSGKDLNSLTKNTLPRLKRLDLEMNSLGRSMKTFAKAKFLGTLEELSLRNNSLEDAGLAELAASPNLLELRRLNLASNGISDVSPLCESLAFANLEFMSLNHNRLGQDANARLLNAKCLPDGMQLELRGNSLQPSKQLKSRFRVVV